MIVSNPQNRGFTLVEMMIVVAIIGLLAVVAIPTFSSYVRASKTVDGNEKTRAIADGALAYFHSEHHYSDTGFNKTAKLYPGCQAKDNAAASDCELASTKTCTEALGQKLEIEDSVWSSQPWKRLGFRLGGPTYYCYYYQSSVALDDSNFEAHAKASLSSDNDSEFTIGGDKDGRLTPLIQKKE